MTQGHHKDELGERLLAAYRDQTAPPEASAQRVWQAVADGTGTAATGAGAGAASGGVTGTAAVSASKLVGLGLAAALGLGGAVWMGQQATAPRSSVAPGAPVSSRDAAPTQEMPAPPAGPTAPPHTPESLEAAPQPDGANRPRPDRGRTHGPSGLAQELSLLRRAQAAAKRGQPKRALFLLRQHERLHPQGVMTEEREAARVERLCELGLGARARQTAQRFEHRFPGSPLAGRVRSACPTEEP